MIRHEAKWGAKTSPPEAPRLQERGRRVSRVTLSTVAPSAVTLSTGACRWLWDCDIVTCEKTPGLSSQQCGKQGRPWTPAQTRWLR